MEPTDNSAIEIEDILSNLDDSINFLNLQKSLDQIAIATNSMPEEYLTHPHPQVRIDAVRALTRWWTSKQYEDTYTKEIPTIDIFIPSMDDEHPGVRKEALNGIFQVGFKYTPLDPRILPLIRKSLNDENPYVSSLAFERIKVHYKYGKYLMPIIEEYRTSKKFKERGMAVELISREDVDNYGNSIDNVVTKMVTDRSKKVRKEWTGTLRALISDTTTPKEVFNKFTKFSVEKYPEIHIGLTYLLFENRNLVRKDPEVQQFLFNHMINGKEFNLALESNYVCAKSFSSVHIPFAKALFKASVSQMSLNRDIARNFLKDWKLDMYWQLYNPHYHNTKEGLAVMNLLLEDDDPDVRKVARYIRNELIKSYNKNHDIK